MKYLHFVKNLIKSLTIFRLIKKRKNLLDYDRIFKSAIRWIDKYSIENKGISVTSDKRQTIYPEVTGYYIPTLLTWGLRERALNFADYLVSTQNMDGSWNEPHSHTPYTFDIGQILKGLMALVDERPEYKKPILRGCEWIMSQQQQNGQILTPDSSAWTLPKNKRVPEAVHLYALTPLKAAAEKWQRADLHKCVDNALQFYLNQPGLTDFTTLSHFHAYIIEGLIDLGETEVAKKAMDRIADIQTTEGAISAYSDVSFTCSTGLFQYAICWYKLGELAHGNRAFDYAASLQNQSGGWYGSYGTGANYFPHEEISWANKYFLDALYWKVRCEFDSTVSIFPTKIDHSDGRYSLIEKHISKDDPIKILDAGCGKGRFISKLKERNPEIIAHGIDISESILKFVGPDINTKMGSLLHIPYPDDYFDLCFCIEALEHAIYIEKALGEMVRVVKPGGILIIVDKNREKLGQMELSDWEQWFAKEELEKMMQTKGLQVKTIDNISYDRGKHDGLFLGWIGEKSI